MPDAEPEELEEMLLSKPEIFTPSLSARDATPLEKSFRAVEPAVLGFDGLADVESLKLVDCPAETRTPFGNAGFISEEDVNGVDEPSAGRLSFTLPSDSYYLSAGFEIPKSRTGFTSRAGTTATAPSKQRISFPANINSVPRTLATAIGLRTV